MNAYITAKILGMEAALINHILVPLDGSTLAECVLPHVSAIAPVTNAHITLVQVLEPLQASSAGPAVDPVEWHLRKQNAEKYLGQIADRLKEAGLLGVEYLILEGNPANSMVDFARSRGVDLIIISTHGQSGLSGWNVSSVVQKILLRSYTSILLVRAYLPSSAEMTKVHYKRLFLGMDGSHRSEFVLPFAISLAQYHNSHLILETVVERPQSINRLPPSDQDVALLDKFVEKNFQAASRYLDQLVTQFSREEIKITAHVSIGDNAVSILHDMAEEANADLVMLAAHGSTGEQRWPYGGVTTSFIAYGGTSLMILQDLSNEEVHQTRAEMSARESKGH
ncbi:MAG TPA: universal stress protein [Anaerolineales bacterium]|nr:universal stress protein [Anaerolineales bacterium]